MAKGISISPQACLDIEQSVDYLNRENEEVALKFFDAVRQTFAQVARMSGIGAAYPLQNPRLQGLRKWMVKGFKKYLIFYLDREDTIEIVRVVHATRDLESVLEEETP